MSLVIKREKLPVGLVVAFLGLLFIKDFIGITIPSIVFTFVWILILLFADTDTSTAFTISSVICFASTVSITIPCAVFIVRSLLGRKTIRLNAVMMTSMYVVIVELCRLLCTQGEDFRHYVNSMVVLLLVWAVIMELDEKKASPQSCIKYYLAFFVFMSFDIVWATVKSLGSISAIVSTGFRIGQVELADETVEGIFSVNANGIALMAILAVASIMLMLSKKRMNLKLAIPMLIYCSLVGLLTVSKTFILVYAGFWILYVLWYASSNKTNVFKPLGLIVVGVIVIVAVWQTDIVQNIIVRFNAADITTGRVDVTNEYLEYMRNDKIASVIGIGLQNITSKVSLSHVPHNAILEIFVCFGVVGLIMYFCFFVSLIRMGIHFIKTETEEHYTFINFIPFVVFITFIQGLQFLRITYIYALIALVFACMVLKTRTANSTRKEDFR